VHLYHPNSIAIDTETPKIAQTAPTWLKYSSSRQSTHGSETSNGRTSLEISQHFIRTIFSWNMPQQLSAWRQQITDSNFEQFWALSSWPTGRIRILSREISSRVTAMKLIGFFLGSFSIINFRMFGSVRYTIFCFFFQFLAHEKMFLLYRTVTLTGFFSYQIWANKKSLDCIFNDLGRSKVKFIQSPCHPWLLM